MNFTCYTEYDRHALTTMAKVLRHTSRKKHSRRSHTFGYAVLVLGVLLLLPRSRVRLSTASLSRVTPFL